MKDVERFGQVRDRTPDVLGLFGQVHKPERAWFRKVGSEILLHEGRVGHQKGSFKSTKDAAEKPMRKKVEESVVLALPGEDRDAAAFLHREIE